MKQLIAQSYEMGKAGYGKYNSAPASNPEFMATVPNCAISDDKGVKLRIKMYKEYARGWMFSNLNQPCE